MVLVLVLILIFFFFKGVFSSFFFFCYVYFLFKWTRLFSHVLLEGSLIMLFAYSSYLLADGMRLSGIVSILFCGIVMAHYTFNNLSAKAREFTREMFDVLASISETFVFAYLGMAVFSFKQLFDVKLILITILLILVARAVNVFPISFIVNLTRKTNKIPLKQQLMLWFSGKEKKKRDFVVCLFFYLRSDCCQDYVEPWLLLWLSICQWHQGLSY